MSVRPFLKWAGNKHLIVDRIKAVLPPAERLVEPFAGSGALFLNTDYSHYVLSDSNADLIDLYRHLQKEGASFMEYCRSFFEDPANSKEVFYERRARFNEVAKDHEKSALFLYLNRHCFNGLCRYNASGGFNAPFGKYSKVYFPEVEMRAFHQKSQRADIRNADFEMVMADSRAGDVIYCDPPYVPLSATANFTSYDAGGFGPEEQIRLARAAEQTADRGIPVLISNHDTPFTRREYGLAKRHRFEVRRSISCRGDRRGKAKEVLAVFNAR